MYKKLIATVSTLAFLTLATTGCFSNEADGAIEYTDENIASIAELHPDIYISSDISWERSSFSGPVEQYDLWLNTTDQATFAENAKTFMAENGWAITEDSTSPIVLRFTKGEWLITYAIQASGKTALFVEPISLYE